MVMVLHAERGYMVIVRYRCSFKMWNDNFYLHTAPNPKEEVILYQKKKKKETADWQFHLLKDVPSTVCLY